MKLLMKQILLGTLTVVALTVSVNAQSLVNEPPALPKATKPAPADHALNAVDANGNKINTIANTRIPAKKEPRWVVKSIDVKYSKISLADANSKQGIKFNLDKKVSVFINDKAATIEQVKAGDKVRVISRGGLIQKIYVESPTTLY
jgi:Cu/Ag efflux protein CusF